jgi:hypothetical protein
LDTETQVKVLLETIATQGLEDEADLLWEVFQGKESRKRTRVWDDDYQEPISDSKIVKPPIPKEQPKNQSNAKRDGDSEEVKDAIMNLQLTLPVGKLLAVAPSVKSKVLGEFKRKVVKDVEVNRLISTDSVWDIVMSKENETVERSVPVVTAKTSRIPVSINNLNIEAHYDGGSETSVIPYSVAKRTGLPITSRNKMMGMIGAGGQHNHFKGEMTVPIKFGDITTLVTLLVLEADDLGYELLLGKPYGISVRILESTNGDGSTDLLAYNDEGTGGVT